MRDVTYIGTTNFRTSRTRFGLYQADRRQHFYCIGKSGTGKSTLLRNLIAQDLAVGRGVAVIDPHGSLAETAASLVPSHRTREVVYFDPADDRPVGFNLLRDVPPDHRHHVAHSVMTAFKSIWDESWGTRLEYILYHAVAALLDVGGATLLDVLRMLSNTAYREHIVSRVTDPVIRRYWVEEYATYSERFRIEANSPVQNKVGQLLASPVIRSVFGQRTSTFDPRTTMDTGRIFIANLSSGILGAENSKLLGAILVSYFSLAALSRADMPEEERRDFHLYVDEVHNFTTSTFHTMLSEARKYRLCLTIAHQYISQLEPAFRDAVFGNVGTLITFRVGAADGDHLAEQFGGRLTGADVVGLPRYNIFVRLLVEGSETHPFSAETLPPMGRESRRRLRKIRRHSRERFGRSRAVIERSIERSLRL